MKSQRRKEGGRGRRGEGKNARRREGRTNSGKVTVVDPVEVVTFSFKEVVSARKEES